MSNHWPQAHLHGVCQFIRTIEREIATGKTGVDLLNEQIVRYLLVAKAADREAYLGIIPPLPQRVPEILLTDAPPYGTRREVSPAVAAPETRRSVGASGCFEQVLAVVIIIDTTEDSERLVF